MSLIRSTFFEVKNILIQTKRFRGKINLRKPKPPHFEKAKFLALTKPVFHSKKRDMSPIELCDKSFNWKDLKNVENPLQRIIANETFEALENSRLVAFYHLNPIPGEELFKTFAAMYKQDMHYKRIGRRTMEMAVQGTKYEAILSLFVSQTSVVFSKEPKIKELLKINKKCPQLILLGGIYDGKFMHLDDLKKYAQVPNLESAQSTLVHTLNASAGKLHRQLNSHQTSLMALLEDRKKQLENKNE